ncbi:hypothetical protein [Marinomonas posidonica]|uniref:hypothetical protein n=1 Tax=Marinomonas posidonica TaxID=936476 RepID=UPI00373611FF
MGGSSKSSNKTTNNVTNYSLQGMENAETVVAGNGNTVTTTDHGAVEGAFDFGESALEFAGNVVDSNERVTESAMNKNSELAGQTIGFASDAIENSLDFSSDLVNKSIASQSSSTNAIKDLAQSLATGGAADAAASSTRTVYTMGAVIVVVMLGMVFMVKGR